METQVLKAEMREGKGTRAARRIRVTGRVPGVLYGHGEAVVNFALPEEQIHDLLGSGSHLVSLELAGKNYPALVKEIQYDTWGRHILHIDLARVALDEIVRVSIPIRPHGTPKAVTSGAVLEQPLHTIEIECQVGAIPNEIRVEVGHLETAGMLHVRDLPLPAGVKALADPEAIVFLVQETREEVVTPAAPVEGATAEPEVIGRGPKEEEEEGEETKETKEPKEPRTG